MLNGDCMEEKVNKQVEELVNKILEKGIDEENLEVLEKLIDIHKDMANEKYWKIKEEKYMRPMEEYGNYGNYGNYGSYGRENYGRRRRDSRGRYTEGYGANYRGEEVMEKMAEEFGRYSEGKEEMLMGNYGAEGSTIKSLDYMLQSVVEFMQMLKKDAASQEEMELIKKYSRKISEM